MDDDFDTWDANDNKTAETIMGVMSRVARRESAGSQGDRMGTQSLLEGWSNLES